MGVYTSVALAEANTTAITSTVIENITNFDPPENEDFNSLEYNVVSYPYLAIGLLLYSPCFAVQAGSN